MHRATYWAASLFITSVFVLVPSFAFAATLTFTSLQASAATAPYDGTVTLTATLTNASAPHAGISGKTVYFTIFAVPVGSATTSSSGVATLTGVQISPLIEIGTHNLYIGAAYLGGSSFIGSVSAATLTVVKADQGIYFSPALSDRPLGNDFTVTALASSTGTTVYAASGDCTVSGNSVHMTTVGSCSITASNPGDNHYKAASTEKSFNITDPGTLYVNATPPTPNGNGGSIEQATSTVQAALAVAQSGDTIDVAAGIYPAFSISGQSEITITGAGASSTFIEPTTLINTHIGHKYTADMMVSVLVNNSTGITLQGLTIKDNGQAPGAGGPDALLFWNASSGTVSDSNITGAYAINGDQTGQGIAVDAGSGQTTDLAVTDVTISGFQKNGIDAVDGNSLTSNPGTITVTVTGGSITGSGSTSVIAQNGILYWNQGGGTVTGAVNGTTISNLEYAPTPEATGILAYGSANVSAVSNVNFSDTDLYIQSASAVGTSTDATTGNIFDTVSPSSATPAQLATIENKLNGEMETSGAAPIFILPRTWIVTLQNLGIQTAINDASSGDTVLVTPGSYNGNFNINKSITFDGAEHGNAVSGRTFNSATESTVSGAAEGTGVITVTAPNVMVDGFSITDVQPLFSALGLVIKNGGDDATVENNIFNNITTADTGGNGTAQAVYFEGAVDGVQILNNLMNDIASVHSAKGILFGDNGVDDGATNTLVKDNMISNVMSKSSGAYGISFGNTTDAQSGTQIEDNTISGLMSGGWIHAIGVEGNAPSIDITGNTIGDLTASSSADVIGIWFEREDTSFSTAKANNNGLAVGSNQLGLAVDPALTGGAVDASCNWWGDASGPGGVGSGSGSEVNAGANYIPWLTTSNLSGPCNGAPTVTVTIDKFIDGKAASTTSASDSFPMQSSWNATNIGSGSGTYSLSTTGFNSSNPYEAITSPMSAGAEYATNEVTGGSVVGADCSDGQPYELAGYTADTSLATAEHDTSSLTSPSLTNITQNEYVIVWNKLCVPAPTVTNPVNGAVLTSANLAEVDWTGVTDAAGGITYTYQASNSSATNADGSLTDPIYTQSGISATNIPTSGTPEGTYYIQVQATDADGNTSAWSPTIEVTVDNSPSATTDAATGVTDTNATLNGTDGSINGDNTSFWWGTTNAGPLISSANPGSELPSGWNHDSGLGTVSADGAFDESFTDLTPGSTYYFVAWVEVSGTWYPGQVLSFTTTGTAPTASVTTDAASSIDLTDATLNGTNGAIAADETSFWWGTTPEASFTSAADPSSEFPASGWSHDPGLPAAGVNGSFNEPLTGLLANTQYYFAAWSHVDGVWYPGSVLTFTTTAPAPSVTTDAALTITSSDATLEGTNGPVAADQVSFWISTTPGIDVSNPSTIPAGVVSTPVTNTVAANAGFSDQLSLATTNGIPGNLPAIEPDTNYYYVAWAYIGGTWYPGGEQSFTTASGPAVPVPGVTTEAADNISDSDATLNGLNGGVDAQDESFWVSTSTIDFSNPSNIPDGVYSTPVLTGGVAANTGFTDDLDIVTTQGITQNGDINMPAITPDTTYYYVAWANIGGTWYNGGQQTFMTDSAPPVPPTAVNDSVTTDVNTPITIDVLANDLNADDLAYFTQPADGVVATSGTEVLYTPNTNFAGNDSFTYEAMGAGGTSAPATVSVSVIDNTTPVLTVNGNNPSYIEASSTYDDQGVTITDPSNNNLDYFVSLDGETPVDSTDFLATSTLTVGAHTIVYSATNGGGNTGYATRTVEVLLPPTVALTSTSVSPTSDNPIHVLADFSEPVTGFSEADLDLSSDSVANFAQASSTEWSFDLTPNGANISVTIDQHTFDNLAGLENDTGATIAFVYTPLEAPNNNSNSNNSGGGGGNGPITCGVGDLNCDGKVNIEDLNILLAAWGDTGNDLAADLNHDGKVDFADLAILLAHWTR